MHLAFALGLVLFALLARRAWCVHGHAHGYGLAAWHHGAPAGCHGRRHRRRWHLRRSLTRRLIDELDANPEQERVISAELARLEQRLRELRMGLGDLAADLALAFTSAELDEAALAGPGARIDAAALEARTAVLEALRAIHGVLEPTQRAHLVHLWASAPWRGARHGFGPYR